MALNRRIDRLEAKVNPPARYQQVVLRCAPGSRCKTPCQRMAPEFCDMCMEHDPDNGPVLVLRF